MELTVGWGGSHEDYARQGADVAVNYRLTAYPGWEARWQLRAKEFPVCSPSFLRRHPLRPAGCTSGKSGIIAGRTTGRPADGPDRAGSAR